MSGYNKPFNVTMDVKIRFSLKACCLYEQLSGKSFFKCNEAEDVLVLLYAMYVTTNESYITYKVFCSMLENKKLAKALMAEYNSITKYLEQLKLNEQFEGYNNGNGGGGEETTITKLVSALIVQHHLDAGYVMNDMQLWEIVPYFQVADDVRKMELVDKRFWTWLTICLHIDSKKIKSADQLFKFEWEKGEKSKAEKDLKEKEEYIKKFFEAQRKAREERVKQKEEQEDGKE